MTRGVRCQLPVEDFHSVNTATSIPSYPGSPEVDLSEFESEGSPSYPHNSHIDLPTTSRIFPVVITNSGGQALFKADINLSSNHVITELSTTTSTVSFSIDVVASLDIPTGESPWVHLTFQKANFSLQYPSGTYPRKKTMGPLTKPKTHYSSYWFEV